MAFPEHILAKLRQRRDLDVGDTSMDAAFNRCPPRLVFSEVCEWEGFLGYTSTILGWIEDVFGVELD